MFKNLVIRSFKISFNSWIISFKKTEIKVELLTDIDILLILYGWAMSRKLPINKFKWINDNFHFNEDFIKNCNEEGDVGYFLKVDAQ